ncbi:TPA: hypothetical protein DDW35_12720, partial [Candidatus Sumerlaeota bacterium]|nr:hypothetical protein [Candidatus Sumerlaeota bacterium]
VTIFSFLQSYRKCASLLPACSLETRNDRTSYFLMAGIALAAVALRIVLLLTYQPWICGDTASYLELFQVISSHSWDSFCGGRTPFYPAFLIATSLIGKPNPYIPVLLQCLLGVLNALLLYNLIRCVTGNRWQALVVGLWSALYLKQAQLEMALLPECVTSFLFTLLLYVWVRLEEKRIGSIWAVLGGLLSLLVLTRPNNLFLLPVFGTRIFFLHRTEIARLIRVRWAVVFCGTALVPLFAWCCFLYGTTGRFTVSNYTGIHLTHKTIDWIDQAPLQYTLERDVLRKYSRDRVQPGIPLDSRMWVALNELYALNIYKAQKSGARFVEISSKLQQMDREMIVAHPFLYLRTVAESWGRFWHPDRFMLVPALEKNDPRSPSAGCVLIRPWLQKVLGQIARPQDFIVHILVWLFPWMFCAYGVWYWRNKSNASFFPVFSGLLILFSALSCALLEYGNGRFVLPYAPVLFCAWSVMGWSVVLRLKNRG